MSDKGKLKKCTFPVLGMSCAGCSSRVEKTLSAQEGVKDVAVNLALATATVTFEANACNPEMLKAALQKIGFDLIIEVDEGVAEEEADAVRRDEYSRLKRRALWALLLSLPVMAIGMFLMHEPWAGYAMWLLSTPVVFVLGRHFFIKAIKLLRHKSANMDTLVATSTGVAYIYSVFALFFPAFWTEHNLVPHVYFEAAAVVVASVMLGRLLEARAKGSTSAAIRNLMGLQPKTVTRLDKDGRNEMVEIVRVGVGDVLMAKPGERIAVDGQVVSGTSYVDESLLNGESTPVEKFSGTSVFAGTINLKGTLTYRAEKVGRDTILSQIVQMVKEAQSSKAPVQRMVDKVAAVFVPIILVLSLFTFLAWLILAPTDGLVIGLHTAVTVLVIACPCALGLATPTAIMVGIGKGAETGILIRDAESLETACHIDTIVFDKTGTLTEGCPGVVAFYPVEPQGVMRDVVFNLERLSEHPLAETLVKYLDGNVLSVSDFLAVPGDGVCGRVEGKMYYVGTRRWLTSLHITVKEEMVHEEMRITKNGQIPVWVADEREAYCLCALADTLKPTSVVAVKDLQQMGQEVWMLTGDNRETAMAIAHSAGIKYLRAGMRPSEKADFVKELQSQGKRVCMVGDGFNDSAALACANLSIAMGKGSDVAMNVAGMTIVSSDLRRIVAAIRLSVATVRTIRQNLFWAFVYNLIGVPIAAGVLYPVCGFLLSPMVAGAAMAMSSVCVVLNSLRLKRQRV